jgi:hypothetical protein
VECGLRNEKHQVAIPQSEFGNPQSNSGWLTRPGFTTTRCQMGRSDEDGLCGGKDKPLSKAIIENAASNTR